VGAAGTGGGYLRGGMCAILLVSPCFFMSLVGMTVGPKPVEILTRERLLSPTSQTDSPAATAEALDY